MVFWDYELQKGIVRESNMKYKDSVFFNDRNYTNTHAHTHSRTHTHMHTQENFITEMMS